MGISLIKLIKESAQVSKPIINQVTKQIRKHWKPGVVYTGKVKGFNLSDKAYKHSENEQLKAAKKYFGEKIEDELFIGNPEVVKDAINGQRSFALKSKNLLKEYLESSQYRKKLRKAGISENQIQERINGLNDVDIRIDKAGKLSPNTNGIAYPSYKQIVFSPKKKYTSRNELIQHELAHVADLDITPNRTYILREEGQMHSYDPYWYPITELEKSTPFVENQNLRYQHDEKVLNDVKNKYLDMSKSNDPEYDKDYFLSLKEMVAKIQPLQINAWKNNWSPKQQVRFLQHSYDIDRMKSLIGEKGIQELIERFLKQGGKIE